MKSLVPVVLVGPSLATIWQTFAASGIFYARSAQVTGNFLKTFGSLGAVFIVVGDEDMHLVQTLTMEHSGVEIFKLEEVVLVFERFLTNWSGGVSSFWGVLQKDKDLSPHYFGNRSFASARQWQRAPAESEHANHDQENRQSNDWDNGGVNWDVKLIVRNSAIRSRAFNVVIWRCGLAWIPYHQQCPKRLPIRSLVSVDDAAITNTIAHRPVTTVEHIANRGE